MADFNNDNIADLAVGIPGESVGAVPGAGAVSVLYGSSEGLSGAESQLWTQDSPGVGSTAEEADSFGGTLAAADYNQDGFVDLAVGAPGESVGPIPDAGAVHVLYGSADGLTGTGSRLFTQDSPGVDGVAGYDFHFGAALAAGDFDDDGRADLAIGVPWEVLGRIYPGGLHVLYGSSGGLTATGSQSFTQDSPGVVGTAEPSDTFGAALAAGDFDHDGIVDLAVAAPFETVGNQRYAGGINVLFGTGGGLTGTGSQLFTQDSPGIASIAERNDSFGAALTTADFDNDNTTDLAIGTPGEAIGTNTTAGAVTILHGTGGGLTGTGSQLFTQDSPGIASIAETEDRFGEGIVAI